MQIKSITYHKVFNLGNYQNEKIGVEIALGEGDDPVVCHMEAVKYVEHAHKFQTEFPTYERAKKVVKDPISYTGYQVREANQLIQQFEEIYKQFLNAYGEPLIGIPEVAESSATNHGDEDNRY